MIKNFKLLICFFLVFAGIANPLKAQAPNWLWAKGYGSPLNDNPGGIIADASGNTYVTGTFSVSTLVMGTNSLTNTGPTGSDILLAKHDAAGNLLWAKREGGNGDDNGIGLATDASNNFYLTGVYSSTNMSIGSTTLTTKGSSDILLTKYNSSGNAIWSRSEGGTNLDAGVSVATDPAGNVFITGYFYSDTLIFGIDTLKNAGTTNMFTAKYNSSGTLQWAKRAGGSNYDFASAVACDAFGNAYVIGRYNGPLVLDTYTLTSSGSLDVCIIKYDPNGNVIWAKSAGGAGGDAGYGICLDAAGNIYMSGSYGSTSITFGSTTLINAGASGWLDMFVVKYDSNGNVLWAKGAGGTSHEYGSSISCDANSNIYVAGLFVSPTMSFGTTTLTNVGGYDIFIAQYDPNGNLFWTRQEGGPNHELYVAITSNTVGDVFIAGGYNSPTLAIGTNTFTNAGGYDFFVGRLANTMGVEENVTAENIRLYPNPAKNIVQLKGETRTYKDAEITILNSIGQVVSKKTFSSQIDVSGLPPGYYILFLQPKDAESIRLKFIIE